MRLGPGYDETTGEWNIQLSRYQRDNLLHLINVAGYGACPECERLPPGLANGDWIGEIAWMLAFPGEDCSINRDLGDRPNAHIVQWGHAHNHPTLPEETP